MCARISKLLASAENSSAQYQLAIILAGSNDLGYSIGAQTIANSIIRTHAICHRYRVKTLALTIPECGYQNHVMDSRRREINQAIKASAAAGK